MKQSNKMTLTVPELVAFFEREGINKSGICREAGSSIQFINQIIDGDRSFTPNMQRRLKTVMIEYQREQENEI